MSLIDVLWPYGSLGNPIEDGKKSKLEQSRTFHMGVDDLREAKIGDKVVMQYPRPYKPDFIEGECSVVEIDGKKLLEEME
jgi:hypothetical protein